MRRQSPRTWCFVRPAPNPCTWRSSGIAYAAPERAAVMLDGIAGFLERNNRVIVIGLGLVFGTWFLLKALGDLGII